MFVKTEYTTLSARVSIQTLQIFLNKLPLGATNLHPQAIKNGGILLCSSLTLLSVWIARSEMMLQIVNSVYQKL